MSGGFKAQRQHRLLYAGGRASFPRPEASRGMKGAQPAGLQGLVFCECMGVRLGDVHTACPSEGGFTEAFVCLA